MILSVTLPFFALVFLGYLAARRRWVPTAAVPAFNGFLLFFAVPAMLFRFAANTPFEQLVNLRFVMAWSIAGVAILLLTVWTSMRWHGVSRREAAFFGLTAAVGNLGFMGVPLLVALLGEGASAAPILGIVVDTVIVGSLGLAIAESSGDGTRAANAMRDAVARIVLNPFIVAMTLGTAFSAFDWKLPTPIASIVKLLADAAGPCALFAIGVSLVRPDSPLRSRTIVLPVAAKLLVHPALAWLVMWALGVDPFTLLVATLAAGLPSAGWVFIFATRYGVDAGRVSATILVTTALGAATFSALTWLLGIGR